MLNTYFLLNRLKQCWLFNHLGVLCNEIKQVVDSPKYIRINKLTTTMNKTIHPTSTSYTPKSVPTSR